MPIWCSLGRNVQKQDKLSNCRICNMNHFVNLVQSPVLPNSCLRIWHKILKKIWPMGCQTAVTSHLISHPIVLIFLKDFASYPETWIWWNWTLFTGEASQEKLVLQNVTLTNRVEKMVRMLSDSISTSYFCMKSIIYCQLRPTNLNKSSNMVELHKSWGKVQSC